MFPPINTRKRLLKFVLQQQLVILIIEIEEVYVYLILIMKTKCAKPSGSFDYDRQSNR
ncbi:hypothetical protein THOB06_10224 [Vibrio rotiferianus]|nr:hypothetical protein THOG10_10224 [Vibrio rotiferianus]CAH1556280.1 hypothetical protein THOB06_10224 [Vibrio rotiferianus]